MNPPTLLVVPLALHIVEQRDDVLAYRAERVLAGFTIWVVNLDDLVLAHEEGP